MSTTKKPVFVELCAGTGALSAAFRDAGWDTWTADIDPAHACDWTGDVRHVTRQMLPPSVDFLHGAPPCPEFSRHSMPWLRAKNPPPPDMSIVHACVRLARECGPSVGWSIENVRGAMPFFREGGLGSPSAILGSFYLWGQLPPIARVKYPRNKERMSSTQRVKRAAYPRQVVDAIVDSVDRAWRLWGRK